MNNKIELFGLPCSGKTTKTDFFKMNGLTIGYSDTKSIFTRIMFIIKTAITYPRLTTLAFLTLIYTDRRWIRMQIVGILRILSRYGDVKSQSKYDVLDEGLYQSVWGLSMFMDITPQSKKLITSIIRIISKAYQRRVLHVKASKVELRMRNSLRIKTTRYSEITKDNVGYEKHFRDWMAFILYNLRRDRVISEK